MQLNLNIRIENAYPYPIQKPKPKSEIRSVHDLLAPRPKFSPLLTSELKLTFHSETEIEWEQLPFNPPQYLCGSAPFVPTQLQLGSAGLGRVVLSQKTARLEEVIQGQNVLVVEISPHLRSEDLVIEHGASGRAMVHIFRNVADMIKRPLTNEHKEFVECHLVPLPLDGSFYISNLNIV